MKWVDTRYELPAPHRRVLVAMNVGNYKDGFPCIRWQDGHCAHYNIVKGTVY